MDLKNNQSTPDVGRVPRAKITFITFCKSQILASFEIEPHDMFGKQINLPNLTMSYKFLFWSSLGWRVTMTPMQPNFLPVRKRQKNCETEITNTNCIWDMTRPKRGRWGRGGSETDEATLRSLSHQKLTVSHQDKPNYIPSSVKFVIKMSQMCDT